MGGGLLGLINMKNDLGLTQMIDNADYTENDLLKVIEKLKNTNDFYYIVKCSGETVLSASCRRNKSHVAMTLLEVCDNILEPYNVLFLLSYRDVFNKTALNYAVSNNMKQVALKILELEKKYKQVDSIVKSIFDETGTWKKIEFKPLQSKFTYSLKPIDHQPLGTCNLSNL